MDNLLKIIKGIILSYGLIFLMLLVYSILLVNTNVGEKFMREIILFIILISSMFASILECKKINKNGMLIGTIISFSSIVLMYVIGSICNMNFEVTKYSLLMLFICILGGMMGGIIGVNLHKEKKAKY